MMRVLVVSALCAAVLATAPIPQNLLNEWSQFKADDQFYDEMSTFLETGSTTNGAGDFEFKCETTCQLVQSAAAASAHASHAAASLLQTEEGVTTPEQDMSKGIEDAFYQKMDSFLETESTTEGGGDFEFKCETTCQLVQASASASASKASRAAANSLLQTEEGVAEPTMAIRPSAAQLNRAGLQNNLEVESGASLDAAKDCYRLCLNPSMNPGCDHAASVTSLLELGSTTHEKLGAELLSRASAEGNKNWSMGNGSGNCLNNCVHVCMAVKDPVA